MESSVDRRSTSRKRKRNKRRLEKYKIVTQLHGDVEIPKLVGKIKSCGYKHKTIEKITGEIDQSELIGKATKRSSAPLPLVENPVERNGKRVQTNLDLGESQGKVNKNESSNCHQCQRNDKSGVVNCASCRRRNSLKRYCYECIAKWYPTKTRQDIEIACPFCCGNCNCKACLRDISVGLKPANVVDNSIKLQMLLYLLHKTLTVVRHIHEERSYELQVEANIRGVPLTDIKVQLDKKEHLHCDICETSIFDLYRSCPSLGCSYKLCLTCCRELREGYQVGCTEAHAFRQTFVELANGKITDCKGKPMLQKRRYVRKCKKATSNDHPKANMPGPFSDWRAGIDGSIPCPPKRRGGCGNCRLALKCTLEAGLVTRLLNKAEYITQDYLQPDVNVSGGCSCQSTGFDGMNSTMSETRQAAFREEKHDNFLYCPNAVTMADNEIEHFQKHWIKGQPVIVRNVLDKTSGLSWEPMVMWRAFRQKGAKNVIAVDLMDNRQVTIVAHQFFQGYLKGRKHKSGEHEILKLSGSSSSTSFEVLFPRHVAEFNSALPFRQYTDVESGFLNLASRLPKNLSKPDLGPKIHIAYGLSEELGNGDSVTMLHYEVSDVVNIMTHTTKAETKPLQNDGETMGVACGGAVWDVFRRKDVPKLTEYLQKNKTEFRNICNLPVESVIHPIHNQNLFLNQRHRKQLKDDYGIEPWTFEQHLGEAVFIPAGCPHQVRNRQSCINAALNFVSPENVEECIRLTEEFRVLPLNHTAKEDRLKVKQMTLYAVSSAVRDAENLMSILGRKLEGKKTAKMIPTVAGHEKENREWEDETTKLFIGMLIDKMKASVQKEPQGAFAWDDLVIEFERQCGLKYSAELLKNEYDRLRSNWSLWRSLVSEDSVLKWDSEKETVVVPDHGWTLRSQDNNDFQKFQAADLLFKKNLELLFSGSTTTENSQQPSTSSNLLSVGEPQEEIDFDCDRPNLSSAIDKEVIHREKSTDNSCEACVSGSSRKKLQVERPIQSTKKKLVTKPQNTETFGNVSFGQSGEENNSGDLVRDYTPDRPVPIDADIITKQKSITSFPEAVEKTPSVPHSGSSIKKSRMSSQLLKDNALVNEPQNTEMNQEIAKENNGYVNLVEDDCCAPDLPAPVGAKNTSNFETITESQEKRATVPTLRDSGPSKNRLGSGVYKQENDAGDLVGYSRSGAVIIDLEDTCEEKPFRSGKRLLSDMFDDSVKKAAVQVPNTEMFVEMAKAIQGCLSLEKEKKDASSNDEVYKRLMAIVDGFSLEDPVYWFACKLFQKPEAMHIFLNMREDRRRGFILHEYQGQVAKK